MGMMIADPVRRWVKGTEFVTSEDDYSSDGTCIGVGTREVTKFARACGVAYASILPVRTPEYDDEFWRDYLAH